MPDVTFDQQGGFQYQGPGPNPFVPPEAVRFYALAELAELSQTWGFSHTPSQLTKRMRLLTAAETFTPLDRGLLQRLVTTADTLVSQKRRTNHLLEQTIAHLQRLETVLTTSLQPSLKLASDSQITRFKAARDKFANLLRPLEDLHGICPPELRGDLWRRFQSLAVVAHYLEGVHIHTEGFTFTTTWDQLEAIDQLPLPKPSSKMGKQFKSWIAVLKQ